MSSQAIENRTWIRRPLRLPRPEPLRLSAPMPQQPFDRADWEWTRAIEMERVILASEWADARGLDLDLRYALALTPDVLDAVESIPFSELGRSTPECRMRHLVRHIELQIAQKRAETEPYNRAPITFTTTARLATRSHERSHRRLQVHFDPRRGRVIVSPHRSEPPPATWTGPTTAA